MAEQKKHSAQPGGQNASGRAGASNEADRVAIQRKRSIAIGVSLALLVVLFYIATLIKMSDGFVDKAGS